MSTYRDRTKEPQEWGSKARKHEARNYRGRNDRAAIEAGLAEVEPNQFGTLAEQQAWDETPEGRAAAAAEMEWVG